MDWVTIKKGGKLPHLHERVLCILSGEPIVLELQEESPTYEETFEASLCWYEPFEKLTQIEWRDVTHWCRIVSPITITQI